MRRRPRTARLFLIAIGTPANGRSSPGSIAAAASQSALAVDVDERVDGRVERGDPRQRGLDELERRQLAAAHERRELGDRPLHQVGVTGHVRTLPAQLCGGPARG